MEREICVLAHNIRSLWNVGSLFRTADVMNVRKLFLTGYTATPPRREISKTAIGAEEWIDWEHANDPTLLLKELQVEGWKVAGLEIADGAIPITEYAAPQKVCLVLGHEVTGIPKELLTLCEEIVSIPMYGRKESLNVAVAAGIALHHLRESV